jgi:bifunctional non-homologous end joining protein LigD
VTATYPELAQAVAALPADCVIDGEVVVLDDKGRPSFQRLQARALLTRSSDVERATVSHPVTLFAFDLLGLEQYDLRRLPLVERKELLRRLLPPAGPLRYADHFEGGERLFEHAVRLGFEGIVGKRADSPYLVGRQPTWRKIRIDPSDDFVVVGFTQPSGTRTAIGALHLGVFEEGELRYAGRVGSGLDERQLRWAREQLEPLVRKTPPLTDAPKLAGTRWVEPRLVCEVRYHEWSRDHLLRQPVFLRFRDDKRPEECVAAPKEAPGAPPHEPPPAREAAPAPRKVPFSNLDKVFWKDLGITKGDLVEYYRGVAPLLLPYLADRPIVLTRYPDGPDGKSFYQKDAPDFVPEWVRTARIWSPATTRAIDYFVCDDLDMLLYVVNLGSIPLHVWSSRVAQLGTPDWCILDLDPKEAPFADVLTVALAIRRLCEAIELPTVVKTSGQAGLHILVPLGASCTYEQSRALGELISRVIVAELPDISTITRNIGARGGRVYLDYMQNRHGQLLVAPYSVRPTPLATVSTPLRWSEVGPKLDPRAFTLRTLPRRLARMRTDPVRPVLTERPDLPAVLARLGERLRRVER